MLTAVERNDETINTSRILSETTLPRFHEYNKTARRDFCQHDVKPAV